MEKKKSASQRYIIGKEKSKLMTFLDNYGHYLTLLQNPTNGNLLKVNCSMESETTSANFSHFITLKSTDPSLNRASLMHYFVTTCIAHLENTGSLS